MCARTASLDVLEKIKFVLLREIENRMVQSVEFQLYQMNTRNCAEVCAKPSSAIK